MATSCLVSAVSPPLVNLLAGVAAGIMESRLRDQLIEREDDPYIERWYLARKGMVPGVSPAGHFLDQVPLISSELEKLYLHRYSRADVEDPHCHPWPNATLVLKGWYVEQGWRDGVAVDVRLREPGDVVLREADDVHAIIDCEPGTVSLFATMPKIRDWGFHTPEGFIPWFDFREWKRAQRPEPSSNETISTANILGSSFAHAKENPTSGVRAGAVQGSNPPPPSQADSDLSEGVAVTSVDRSPGHPEIRAEEGTR